MNKMVVGPLRFPGRGPAGTQNSTCDAVAGRCRSAGESDQQARGAQIDRNGRRRRIGRVDGGAAVSIVAGEPQRCRERCGGKFRQRGGCRDGKLRRRNRVNARRAGVLDAFVGGRRSMQTGGERVRRTRFADRVSAAGLQHAEDPECGPARDQPRGKTPPPGSTANRIGQACAGYRGHDRLDPTAPGSIGFTMAHPMLRPVGWLDLDQTAACPRGRHETKNAALTLRFDARPDHRPRCFLDISSCALRISGGQYDLM
jgi:hypothetical protein